MPLSYCKEDYWDDVAVQLSMRDMDTFIAGDNDPYYHYKRARVLLLLKEIDFKGKKVLELGPGPGGNLLELSALQPREIHGVDASEKMVALAKQAVQATPIKVIKTDAGGIPYPDAYFDISFTITVLQHTTHEIELQKSISELSRVTGKDIYLFERVEKKQKGSQLCMGRPVAYYAGLFAENGFSLQATTHLKIGVSRMVCAAIRKLCNRWGRKEGQAQSALSTGLQKLALPLTKKLDNLFGSKSDLARLHFVKK